jgi:restriction system protein
VPEKYQWLRAQLESAFREFHVQRACNAAEPEFEELSGTEFETYLARLLKQHGFENIRGTAASGDQGADLLATKANRTIVIQAKRYRGAVGNKAVQEVVAAVKFYSADEGWVITSGTFTPSAKALAQANGVRLVDGYALRNDLLC